MFKLFLFVAILAFASAAPGGEERAHSLQSIYPTALSYSAYAAPISYSAPLTYASAYGAPSYAYSSHYALPYAYAAAKPFVYAV